MERDSRLPTQVDYYQPPAQYAGGFAQQPQQPQPDGIDPRAAWNVIRRNQVIILLCLVLAIAAAAILTRRATPIYQAQTSMRVEGKQNSGLENLQALSGDPAGDQISTEMQVLRSRILAEDVADSLNLRLSLKEPRGMSRNALLGQIRISPAAASGDYVLRRTGSDGFTLSQEARAGTARYHIGDTVAANGVRFVLLPAAARYSEIQFGVTSLVGAAGRVQDGLAVVRPDHDANIVVVRYKSTDPQLAEAVPNALSRHFIVYRQRVQKTQARSTVAFLREQLDSLTKQLSASENALRSFRESAQVVDLQAEAGAQVTRLASLQAERSALDVERSSLAKLLGEVQAEDKIRKPDDPSPYRRLLSFPTLLKSGIASQYLVSLGQLEDQRAALLTRRTAEAPEVQALTARIHDVEGQLRSAATTYTEGLQSQQASVDAALAQFGQKLQQIPAKEVQYARLARQPKVLEDISTQLQSRLKEAQIQQAIEDPSVQIVDTALVPVRPISPRRNFNLVAGAILGLMLGLGIAFLREQLDNAVHTGEDVQRVTRLPVLGLIPQIAGAKGGMDGVARVMDRFPHLVPGWLQGSPGKVNGSNDTPGSVALASGNGASRRGSRIVTSDNPSNHVSEAYRGLRTNITFARPDNPAKLLVFTSPMPGDGKSTSAANLAITLAQQGLNVLLVDADLRRGVMHSVFKIAREPGLSNVLLGNVPLEAAVRQVNLGTSGTLSVLGTGVRPPNPAELLGSGRMRDFMEHVQDMYDMVIFDTPPLNVVTDAAILGSAASGVVLVARAGVTTHESLAFAVEQLRNVRASVLGTILNDINFKRDVRYYGSHGSYAYYRYHESY